MPPQIIKLDIDPHFRSNLSDDDSDFIIHTLGQSQKGKESGVAKLLKADVEDPDDLKARDMVLGNHQLSDALENGEPISNVSPNLFFYILLGEYMRQQGVPDPNVRAYVAAVLASPPKGMVGSSKKIPGPRNEEGLREHTGDRKPYEYFFEQHERLKRAGGSKERFLIRTRMANQALFLLGLFPEYMEQRAQRGAPGKRYFTAVARTQYDIASQTKVAERTGLSDILGCLCEYFTPVVTAVNEMKETRLDLSEKIPNFSSSVVS
jgi:hypothetical protein